MPTNGGRAYTCPALECKMYPHYCWDYQTKPEYRRAWDEGRGPGQPQPARTTKPRKAEHREPIAIARCRKCEEYDPDMDLCMYARCGCAKQTVTVTEKAASTLI